MATDRVDRELRAEERVELRQAKRLLAGSGLSIADAIKLALAQRTAAGGVLESATIDEAVDGFLRRALTMKLREQTFDFYEAKLGMFSRAFEGKRLDDAPRSEIRGWIDGLPGERTTARGTLRAVHALYAWARSCQPPLCSVNPCEGLRVEIPKVEKSPVVLTAKQVEAMLAAAGRFRHALAIMVFAGVRPHEVAGRRKPPLQWEHVDRKAKVIRIPAEIAKTRKPRVLEKLPPALWTWLADGLEAGPICPGLSRQATRAAWKALKPLRPDWKKWPSDVLRDTAASYLLALWQDAGRVSVVLGHEGKPSMLFVHYRAVMTKAQAQEIADVLTPVAEAERALKKKKAKPRQAAN